MSGKLGMTSRKPRTPPADARPGDDLATLMDGRRAWVKAIKARAAEHMADLGGEDHLSAAKRSLIQRAVNLECWITATEARIASGSLSADDDLIRLWLQSLGTLAGIYSKIGLNRKGKDIPDLKDYLEQREVE